MSAPTPHAAGEPLPGVAGRVESVGADGAGVVRVEDRTFLVDGVLAGERVLCRPRRGRRHAQRADLIRVLEPAEARSTPPCPHFALCGGCRLQHVPVADQVSWKERALLAALRERAGVVPESVATPLTGPTEGYRRRARLGVKHVPKKGGVLVGFREKHSAKLAELDRCVTLDPRVGERIAEIRRLLDGLSVRHRIPQLEVALGEGEGDAGAALVLRHLEPLSATDRDRLAAFARARGWQVHLQPGGPDTIVALWPRAPGPLTYRLPAFDLELAFLPTDFVQVNGAMNRALVDAAVEALDPAPDATVVDLFCGIGNFSLALARRAGRVLGVEGSPALVSRARDNASRNRIDDARFVADDLLDVDGVPDWWPDAVDGLLLDPPRSGAGRLLRALAGRLPGRIVYVSCNPETLAADAGELVGNQGYRLESARVVDMFPHTAHSEAMAIFDGRGP